jgi:hypothetical protein
LRGISERSAWNDWLEYFLLGVARMSEDALSRANRINHLLGQWQKRVSGESTNNPLRVVELLGANPFITTTGAATKLGVAFTTAQRAIERLERAGILNRWATRSVAGSIVHAHCWTSWKNPPSSNPLQSSSIIRGQEYSLGPALSVQKALQSLDHEDICRRPVPEPLLFPGSSLRLLDQLLTGRTGAASA